MADPAAGGGRGHGAEGADAGGGLAAVRAAAGGDGGAGRVALEGADGAPYPRGLPADRAMGDGDKKLWLAGNENRDVEVKKVLLEGSPFKSDYTPTELKNKALENIHKELQALQKLINSGIASEKTMMEYKKKYAEAKALSEEIKRGDGMPIPLPSELKKVPKAKEM